MLVTTKIPWNFVIIGNPENRRVTMFQKALSSCSQPIAQVVSYLDLISGKVILPEVVKPNSIIRIDSPGENFAVEKALLVLGAKVVSNSQFASITAQQAQNLSFNQGLILYPYQWYLGYCKLLENILDQLADCPVHRLMNHPNDIALMFDKRLCQKYLLENNITVAPSLGEISCFDELVEKMKQANWQRVFVKLANSSSASGVVAYQTNGVQHIATTSTKLVKNNRQTQLFNSLKLSTYRSLSEVKELIDLLCQHQIHVERWIPKASFQDGVFDLRVLVIRKKAQQIVVRTSKSPITNLHLLNKRGDLAGLKAKIDPEYWEMAMKTCENTMKLFPNSLYGGLDLLFSRNFKKQFVLEVNAFGDLLPNVLYNQLNSYEAEVLAMLN